MILLSDFNFELDKFCNQFPYPVKQTFSLTVKENTDETNDADLHRLKPYEWLAAKRKSFVKDHKKSLAKSVWISVISIIRVQEK